MIKKEVLLSIDFDYFVREHYMWDFGHSEEPGRLNLFSTIVWQLRYGNIKLYDETDPKKYADFMPEALPRKLKEKGLLFDNSTKYGIAESHEKAYQFFNNGGSIPKTLIHIDAHHDVYDRDDKVHCGNWLYHLMKKYPDLEVYFVYPKWSKKEGWIGKDNAKVKTLKWTTFDQLPIQDAIVKSLFFCRSGVWVAPHHDKDFMMLMYAFAFRVSPRNIVEYGIIKREAPSKSEAEKMYDKSQAEWKRLKAEADKSAPIDLDELLDGEKTKKGEIHDKKI